MPEPMPEVQPSEAVGWEAPPVPGSLVAGFSFASVAGLVGVGSVAGGVSFSPVDGSVSVSGGADSVRATKLTSSKPGAVPVSS